MNKSVRFEGRPFELEGRVRFRSGPIYYVSTQKDLSNLFEEMWHVFRDEDRYRILRSFQRWQRRRTARSPRIVALLRILGCA
jgi:hypothetical protein